MLKKCFHMRKSMKLASLLLGGPLVALATLTAPASADRTPPATDSPIAKATTASGPIGIGPITDVPLTPITPAQISPSDAPEFVLPANIQWSGLTAPGCGAFTDSYKYCALLFNEEHGKGLRYGTRDYGINLTWGDPDHFTFRRQNTNNRSHLIYGEPLAIHNKTGGWMKYGKRDYGINLVFTDLPAYEWYIVGGELGTVVDSEPFALWNKSSGQFLVYGGRTHGINLVWAVTVGVSQET